MTITKTLRNDVLAMLAGTFAGQAFAVTLFTSDAAAEFGEPWQGRGLTHDLLSAAFYPPST